MAKQPDVMTKLDNAAVKEPASWEKAIRIQADGAKGQYTATCYPDWTFGSVNHGGVTFAVSIQAAKAHCGLHLPKSNLPDAISSSIGLLRPIRCGTINIHVHELKIGSQYSTFRVSTYQTDKNRNTTRQCTEATITLGSLERESANPAALQVPAPTRPLLTDSIKPPPTREGWITREQITSGMQFYNTKNYTCMHPPGIDLDNETVTHPSYGPFVRETWWKGDEPWTAEHIPFLIDLGRPMHLNHPESHREGSKYYAPTLSLSLELKKRPPPTTTTTELNGKNAGSEWLFQRAEMVEFKDGRHIVDMSIIDEEGEVIALARHVLIAVPLGGRFGKDAKEKKKDKSKL